MSGYCPCHFTDPCKPNCTCHNPFLSGGCSRCCTYGSKEQQKNHAKVLAKIIDAALSTPKEQQDNN